MSYTATVESKGRCELYRGSDDFTTDTRFKGQAISGTMSIKDWSHCDDIDLGMSVHVSEEATVEASTIKHTGHRDFVTVDIASYYDDGETLKNPEATLFVSVEQARALRDSLNALDI